MCEAKCNVAAIYSEALGNMCDVSRVNAGMKCTAHQFTCATRNKPVAVLHPTCIVQPKVSNDTHESPQVNVTRLCRPCKEMTMALEGRGRWGGGGGAESCSIRWDTEDGVDSACSAS